MRPGAIDKLGLGAAALRAKKPVADLLRSRRLRAHRAAERAAGLRPADAGAWRDHERHRRRRRRAGARRRLDRRSGRRHVGRDGHSGGAQPPACHRRGLPRLDLAVRDRDRLDGAHIGGYLAGGKMRRPIGSGVAEIVPHQAFPTADGHIMVAAGNDNLFRALCGAMERHRACRDGVSRRNSKRVENRRMLIPMLEEFSTRAQRRMAGAARCGRRAGRADRERRAGRRFGTDRSARHAAKGPDLDMTLTGLPLEFDGVRRPIGSPRRRSASTTIC